MLGEDVADGVDMARWRAEEFRGEQVKEPMGKMRLEGAEFGPVNLECVAGMPVKGNCVLRAEGSECLGRGVFFEADDD